MARAAKSAADCQRGYFVQAALAWAGGIGVVAHYSLAYSALACLRMGTSGSASFKVAKKS